jgi:tetratricopeptide (TPR) repeat protein
MSISFRSLLLALPFVLALPAPAPAAPFPGAPDETVEGLIAQGRARLADGSPLEAQAAFDRAAELDGGSPGSRVWVLRGWIAARRVDETLLAVDDLKREGASESDLDYLYGLAFLEQARASIASRGGDRYTQGQVEDAARLLSKALAADPERYRDAWAALAEAAWRAGTLEEARAAAEHAVGLEPHCAAAQALLGRIAFAQHSAADRAGDTVARDEDWSAALAAFRAAIDALGEPSDAAQRAELADLYVQCGNLHAWKQDLEAAAGDYAAAMAADPGRVDYNAVHTALGPEAFATSVAGALARFEAAGAPAGEGLATLLWWHGYALYEGSSWSEAEGAFRRALAAWPAYTSAWYYVFHACVAAQRRAEAVGALQSWLDADAGGLVAALSADAAGGAGTLESLVGWCADPARQQGRPRNEDAALLCDVLTRLQPDVSRHWNNLGLFLRDRADELRRTRGRDADPAEVRGLYERAFEAYEKALALEPENPGYLNDTAVMLHYYLQRDLDRARSMYEQAAEAAERELGRADRAPDARELFATARRDARDNLRRLDLWRERTAAGEDVDPLAVR